MVDWTTLTGPEDGGIGALIVAIVWLVVEWWKKRSASDSNVARRN